MSHRLVLPPVAQSFFDPIDWENHPLALVDPNCAQDTLACKLSSRAIGEISRKVRPGILRLLFGAGCMMMSRPLSFNRYPAEQRETYETEWGIENGGFEKIIDRYRKQTGKSALSVLDPGCGDSYGFGEILELDGVNQEQSIGITIDRTNHAPVNTKDRIAKVNVATIVPRNIDGDRKRFDVLASVFSGMIMYHPFNPEDIDFNNIKFGFLHAINFVKIGGLIFTNEVNYWGYKDIVDKLIKLGILEIVEDFDEFALKKENNPRYGAGNTIAHNPWHSPSVVRVARRPTIDEIKNLLNIKNGVYDMGSRRPLERIKDFFGIY